MKYRLIILSSIQITLSSLVCTAFNLIYQGSIDLFFPYCLVVYSPLMVFINTFLLHKIHSVRTLGIINVFLAIVSFCLVFFLCRTETVGFCLLSIPFFIFFAFLSLKFSVKGVSDRFLLRLFDFSIIMLFITLFYITHYSYRMDIAYMNILGVSVALFALILQKQISDKNRSTLSFIFISIAIMAFLLAFLIFYGSYVGAGLVWLWEKVLGFNDMISRFINWLFSILPKINVVRSNNLIPLVTDDTYRQKDIISEPLDDNVLEIILIVLGSIIGIIVLFYFLKNIHLNIHKKRKRSDKQESTGLDFVSSLKKALDDFRTTILCKIYILKNRDNAIGLYFYFIDVLKNSELCKLPAEAPDEFLYRIERTFSTPEKVLDLTPISRTVTFFFFSDNRVDNLDIDNAMKLRRIIRVGLFKNKLRKGGERFKELSKAMLFKLNINK